MTTKVPSNMRVDGGRAAGNLLMNPLFRVNQRGYVSGAATAGANQYTVDRWRVVTSGQALSWAGDVATAPAGGVEQVIEAANIVAGAYTLSWTGTATATVAGASVANGAQVTLTAVDTTVRFTGGTVSYPQLEPGSEATTFQVRSYAQELAMCQRYFYQATGEFIGVTLNSGDGYASAIRFPVTMRAAPALVSGTFTPATGSAGTVALASTTTSSTRVFNSAANWTAGTTVTLTAGFNAEL